MAGHNVADVDLCRADALRPVTRDAVVLVDPARRSGGRRRFDPRDYTPPLDALLDVYRDRDLVVKCAPGIDFDELSRLGFSGEIEVTSLAGSVREACLWSAGLAEAGVTRRATMLDSGEGVTDAEPDDCPVAPAGRWIVDPDGAVVRAGLVRHYAARHGLWQLDPDIAYLSGDRLPEDVRGFEVLEELGYSERRLRQALSARDVGAVEILVRGVDVDPDALRARLRLRGSQSACRSSSPASAPGRQVGQRHSSAVRRGERPRTPGSNAPAAEPVPALEDVRRCAFSGWLRFSWPAYWPARPAHRRPRRQSACADLGGAVGPDGVCTVHPRTPPTRWTSPSPTTIPTCRR